MGAITIQFEGVQDQLLKSFVKLGIARTKSEAIRLAVTRMALDTGVIRPKDMLDALRKTAAKNRLTVDEIMKSIERAKNETVS